MQLQEAVCACATARRTARAVTQLYNLVLSITGLKATQLIALKTLADQGEIAQWQFAAEYGFSVETLSRRLGALQKSGLVQVRRARGSSAKLYSLTPLGKAKLDEALPHWERAQRRLLQVLGEKRWAEALRTLDEVATAARSAECARASNAA